MIILLYFSSSHQLCKDGYVAGQSLGSGTEGIPVFLYGYASPTHAGLADVRRSLGYFKGSREGKCKLHC